MKTLEKDGVRYRGAKRRLALIASFDKDQILPLDEAVKQVKALATAKFDEAIELHYKLNIKQKHSIRDTIVMPHNVGKEKRVLVFAEGDLATKATEAGASYVGGEELVQKIRGGWLEFDAVIATPDMMPKIATLGPVLGRRKMMPNPKTGTVTTDVASAIQEYKAGKVEVRADKTGNVHVLVGRKSHNEQVIYDNVKAVHGLLMRNKPSDLKGEYIKTLALAPTMGVSVRVDLKKMV